VDLEALTRIIRGPVPNNLRNSRGYHRRALTATVYRNALRLPTSMHTQVEQLLSQWSGPGKGRDQWRNRCRRAAARCVGGRTSPIAGKCAAVGISGCSRCVPSGWRRLPTTIPAPYFADLLRPKLQELSAQFGYDKSLPAIADVSMGLTATSRRYGTYPNCISHRKECYSQARRAMGAGAPPSRRSGWPCAHSEPGCIAARAGSAVQLSTTGARLRSENLQEAAAFAREYSAFTSAQHLGDSRDFAVYARILRRQLQSVLDEGMRNAR